MMTIEKYEELYCTYCDSQRCVKFNKPTPESCPYWNLRQESNINNQEK